MAAKKEKTGNRGAFERLQQDLKNQTPARVYVFYGEESYLRQSCLRQLQELLIPAGFEEFNYHRLSGKNLTAQEIADAVEALPMMAPATLVTVTDWSIYEQEESQREQIIEVISDVPEYCTLVFVYDTIPFKKDGKMRKLSAALGKYAELVEFQPQPRDTLVRWLQKLCKARGHEMDAATADYMLFYCGTQMDNLLSELEKITAYAPQPQITRADIEAAAEPILDARVFDLTNQITARKSEEAARVLGTLLQMQSEPIMLLGVVGKELRRLYTARMALDNGKDRFWLMELWNMSSDYPAKLLLQAAQHIDHDWCQWALKECQILDRRMKSEKGIDREGELIRLITELTIR